MKQALLMISVFGFGMVQAYANITGHQADTLSSFHALSDMEYGSDDDATTDFATITSFATSNNQATMRVYHQNQLDKQIDKLDLLRRDLDVNQDGIEEMINQLSKHRNNQIDAQRAKKTRDAFLAAQTQQQGNILSALNIDSTTAPSIAAAHASRAAGSRSRSSGYCARYVRQALQAAGYQFTPNASAYQYASRGTLAQAGFSKISNNSRPQVGDVVVFDRTSRYPHGHIQIWDGKNWVSDFRQNDINPYSGAVTYTTWRDNRYLNNASESGTYLAMAE